MTEEESLSDGISSGAPAQYQRLKARRMAEATREFNARGKSVVRCESCQLASYACICDYRPRCSVRSRFLLLMHRNELLKPTNTGRLIADVLPEQTLVACWSRTDPHPELLQLLEDPTRQCLLIYPEDDSGEGPTKSPTKSLFKTPEPGILAGGSAPTFILLDGTWKQARRMMKLSRWLQHVPRMGFPESLLRGYAVRKSEHLHHLSTAEAAALCLQWAGEVQAADTLLDYFQLFNLHYLATRGCYTPEPTVLHGRLREQAVRAADDGQ